MAWERFNADAIRDFFEYRKPANFVSAIIRIYLQHAVSLYIYTLLKFDVFNAHVSLY